MLRHGWPEAGNWTRAMRKPWRDKEIQKGDWLIRTTSQNTIHCVFHMQLTCFHKLLACEPYATYSQTCDQMISVSIGNTWSLHEQPWIVEILATVLEASPSAYSWLVCHVSEKPHIAFSSAVSSSPCIALKVKQTTQITYGTRWFLAKSSEIAPNSCCCHLSDGTNRGLG